MATYYVLNTTIVATNKYFAGDLVDDAVDSTSTIAAAGAVLWPSSDATVAAQAAIVQSKRAKRSANEQECESLMYAAASASLKAGGSIAAATTSAQGAMSAADKKFLDGKHSAAVALTDAPETLTVGGGTWYRLPAATLSATRAKTLGTTGAVAGDQIEITRLDATANTMTVVNGGSGAGTLFTFPVSKIGSAVFQFDGTDWALRSVGYQA